MLRLADWSWTVVAGTARMVHPRGLHAGAIQYRERISPIRSVGSLLEERHDPAFTPRAAPTITPMVTDEGEYAALVEVTGVRDGAPLHRVLGVTFGDDWYSEILAGATDENCFSALTETVRDLVRRERLLLGNPRRRRFNYPPPAGWSSYAPLPLVACWFPADYTDNDHLITVYPALPHDGDERLQLDALLVSPAIPAMVLDEVAPPTDLALGPLVGRQWSFRIRNERGELIRLVALLRSTTHYYCITGDARPATLAPLATTFQALVASIEPLPLRRSTSAVSSMSHWSE